MAANHLIYTEGVAKVKRTLYIILISFFVLGLIFLGGYFPKGQDTAVTNLSETVAYKVAVSGTFPPFGYVGKEGKPQGFEIDLINAIAGEEGFKVKCEVTSWQGIMSALKSKNADILLESMTITDERKKEVDFSDPYFESTNYIMVPQNSQIQSLEDLKGKTVACSMGTTGDIAISKLLGSNYEGIKRFKKTSLAFLELKNHKVDAAIGDSGIVMYYIKSNPEAKLRIVEDIKFPKEYYGMAVRKGDTETLQKINSGLKKIKENGKYEELLNKWFQN